MISDINTQKRQKDRKSINAFFRTCSSAADCHATTGAREPMGGDRSLHHAAKAPGAPGADRCAVPEWVSVGRVPRTLWPPPDGSASVHRCRLSLTWRRRPVFHAMAGSSQQAAALRSVGCMVPGTIRSNRLRAILGSATRRRCAPAPKLLLFVAICRTYDRLVRSRH